jgi:drug/metabolite transporter (DMT)-like permease
LGGPILKDKAFFFVNVDLQRRNVPNGYSVGGSTGRQSRTCSTPPEPHRIRHRMTTFVVLCLLSRLAYAVNDVLVGRLARQYSHVEVAALRGLSLGLTMAPILFWVPAPAWGKLAEEWRSYLLLIVVTAIANVLQNRAARFLPFGLRAAVLLSAVAVASIAFGAAFFTERLSAPQLALCVVLVGSALVGALGTHATHEIQPDVPKGSALALAAGVGLAVAGLLTKRLAVETHPLLTAWAWELGAGACLAAPLLWEWRHGAPPDVVRRFYRIAAASAPTVIGSAASLLALGIGALGLWGALAGTQVLFTAALGVLWHRETMGPRRWLCFAAAAGALSGLALLAP